MSVATLLPEAVRNARIQLRPKRMLAAALLAIIGSITAYVSYNSGPAPDGWGLLEFLIMAEITVLAIGGGIYCLQSIHREKELNTFDYQRITRSTPLELTLGKLLGAPSLMYFIVLCLLPVTAMAAVLAGISLSTLLAICAIVLLGSIALHALALLASALSGQSSSAGAIVGFLILIFVLSVAGNVPRGSLALGSLSPYFVDDFLGIGKGTVGVTAGTDLLLGHAVPHVPVLIVLYLFFTAWFLLGLVRIIKRDPGFYEVYSPPQALAFVLSLDLIVILFFNWTRTSFAYDGQRPIPIQISIVPTEAQGEFLGISLWLFALLGLALLRNRERVRTRIKHLGAKASGLWAALWPAPYLFCGFLGAGLAMVALIQHRLGPESDWMGMAVFEVCFVALWITRDALYLQWMNLRRGRRPLITGFIYLIAFYACVAVLSVSFRIDLLRHRAFQTLSVSLNPWAVFALDQDGWGKFAGFWIVSLLLLVLEALVFAALQRTQLTKLRDSAALAERESFSGGK